MDIYTSYYSNMRGISLSEYTLVQISRSKPSWFSLPCCTLELAYPSGMLLKDWKDGTITWKEYTERYKEQVTPHLDEIKQQLQDIYYANGGKKIILLCWEKNICHRFILGKLLNMNVSEWARW